MNQWKVEKTIVTAEQYLGMMKEIIGRLEKRGVKKMYTTKEVLGMLDVASEAAGIDPKKRVQILKDYFGSLENASTINEYTVAEVFTILDAAILGIVLPPLRNREQIFVDFVAEVVFKASKSTGWPLLKSGNPNSLRVS